MRQRSQREIAAIKAKQGQERPRTVTAADLQAHKEGEYTLYTRTSHLRGGPQQHYFFAKTPPTDAAPAKLPDHMEVVHPKGRGGMPVLRNKRQQARKPVQREPGVYGLNNGREVDLRYLQEQDLRTLAVAGPSASSGRREEANAARSELRRRGL